MSKRQITHWGKVIEIKDDFYTLKQLNDLYNNIILENPDKILIESFGRENLTCIHMVNQREETDAEYNARIANQKLEEEKRKKERYEQYLLLKEEFDKPNI